METELSERLKEYIEKSEDILYEIIFFIDWILLLKSQGASFSEDALLSCLLGIKSPLSTMYDERLMDKNKKEDNG